AEVRFPGAPVEVPVFQRETYEAVGGRLCPWPCGPFPHFGSVRTAYPLPVHPVIGNTNNRALTAYSPMVGEATVHTEGSNADFKLHRQSSMWFSPWLLR